MTYENKENTKMKKKLNKITKTKKLTNVNSRLNYEYFGTYQLSPKPLHCLPQMLPVLLGVFGWNRISSIKTMMN